MDVVRKSQKRVVVAMSGGVDSSVAAALLKKEGFDVVGIFLRFWRDPKATTEMENLCCSLEGLMQARRVADKLKIPFYVLDTAKEFKKQIVDHFILEYESGRTPNPCVRCNQFIKFGWLLRKAKELGAEYLATGHYARRACELKTPSSKFKTTTQNLKLLKAKDRAKDQTYFLWQLSRDQLKHILFPIGDYKKSEVRKMAKKWGLPVAGKKDSQGICFIPDRDNPAFLQRYTKRLNKPGKIIDQKGNLLGQHRGLAYYTIGQRHGLEGIQLRAKNEGQRSSLPPAYVVRLDRKGNQLIVGEEKDLYSKELIAEKVNWINAKRGKLVQSAKMSCQAKIRYGHKAARGKLKTQNSSPKTVKVIFNKAQRAITPGQSIVFYKGEEVLGGGIIR